MRIARYAPRLLGGLLVLRVLACGGGGKQGTGGGGATGQGGAGTPPGPSGTCVNAAIQYMSGGQTETHTCLYGCSLDAATGSASCVGEAGVKPFRTCRSASDCMGASYCAMYGNSFAIQLGSPTCVGSVCDWATETQQSCTGGQLCYPSACATIQSGTTSGGFPWTGQGGTCGSSGCSSGRGGQSGASGGQSGTTGTGGTGGGGGATTSGTCVNGDVSYTSNGQAQVHACAKHDCWIDVATGSAACATLGASEPVPFRTCRLTADCAGITYCAPQGSSTEFLPGNPGCVDSVCDWSTVTSRACPAGYVCYPSGCSMGLWDGGVVTGTGGFGGTTSGGFPWDAAATGK